MAKKFDFNKAPNDQIFGDIKEASIKLWQGMDFHPDYINKKVLTVEQLQNISDNVWVIVGMYDLNNQMKLLQSLRYHKKAAYHFLRRGLLEQLMSSLSQ